MYILWFQQICLLIDIHVVAFLVLWLLIFITDFWDESGVAQDGHKLSI